MDADGYFSPTVFTKITMRYFEMVEEHPDWKEDKIIEKLRDQSFRQYGFLAREPLNAVFFPSFIFKIQQQNKK